MFFCTPYNKIPAHGFLAPTNISGNLIGIITASYNDFFAILSPATSSHLTLGFSVTIADDKAYASFSFSSFFSLKR